MLNLIHTEEFEKFKDFETKISVLHFQLEEASRNFEIFSKCLELKQITNYRIYYKYVKKVMIFVYLVLLLFNFLK